MHRPLNHIEQLYWRVNRAVPLPGFFMCRISGPLDERLLARALQRVQARHPLLKVRVEGDMLPVFTSERVPPIPLRVLPLQGTDHWQQEVENELNRPEMWSTGALAHAVLLSGDGSSDVLLFAHHVLADGFSMALFAKEVLHELGALANGRYGERPPAPVRPALEAMLPPEARGAGALLLAARYLRRLTRGLAGRLLTVPAAKQAPPKDRRSIVVHARLAAETLRALLDRSRRERTTVHGALCAAALQSIEAAFRGAPQNQGARQIVCVSPVNLRQKLRPMVGEEIGLFATPLVTVYALSELGDFWALARTVRDRLHPGTQQGEGLGPWAIQPLLPPPVVSPEFLVRLAEKAHRSAITVSNIGRMEPPEDLGPFRVEKAVLGIGVNAIMGSSFTLSVATFGDYTSLTFTQAEPLVSRAQTEALAQDMVRRLHAAV